MISFKQFLSEDRMTPAEAAKLVYDECFEFLDASGFSIDVGTGEQPKITSGGLWRGVKTKLTSPFEVKSPRSLRNPTDNSQAIHDALDNHLENHFGFNYRSSGLFCTPAKMTASMYGFPALIFPVDGFSFVYSTVIRDAYIFFDISWSPTSALSSAGVTAIMDDMDLKRSDITNMSPDEWAEIVYDWLEKTKPYTDKNLRLAMKSDVGGPEIMIKCSKYYAVDSDTLFFNNFLIELDKLL